ncbi:hypothetical protein AVEN_234028-1, partial [Araneus ventricosus]
MLRILDRGGLVVRSRLRGWTVPGSKPDSTEDPPSKWLEKHRVNTFSQSEIVITSDEPSDEDIVFLIKEKNGLIDDSSSDMEEEGDGSSGPSIPDTKAAVNILQDFFATETVDKNAMYSLLNNSFQKNHGEFSYFIEIN